jgi:hypothetical protein
VAGRGPNEAVLWRVQRAPHAASICPLGLALARGRRDVVAQRPHIRDLQVCSFLHHTHTTRPTRTETYDAEVPHNRVPQAGQCQNKHQIHPLRAHAPSSSLVSHRLQWRAPPRRNPRVCTRWTGCRAGAATTGAPGARQSWVAVVAHSHLEGGRHSCGSARVPHHQLRHREPRRQQQRAVRAARCSAAWPSAAEPPSSARSSDHHPPPSWPTTCLTWTLVPADNDQRRDQRW